MKISYNKIIIRAILYMGLTPFSTIAQDTVWVRQNAPATKETYAVSFSADDTRIFSGSECSPSYLRIFSTATGELLWNYELGSTMMCVSGVKLSSDGKMAAAMEEFGNLHIFDYSGAIPVLTNTISTGTTGAFALDFSPDGHKIVTGCVGKKMNIYDVGSGGLLHSLDAHDNWVQAVDWSVNGPMIASGGSDKLVKIWDTAGNLLRTLSGHAAAVLSVKFTNDAKYIVSSSKDKTIKIWETATGNIVRSIPGHTGAVMQIDIADDATTIVSGSEDSSIRIWDFNTGVQLKSFRLNRSGKVYSVDYSSDGRHVAAGTANGNVQLWNVATTTEVNAVMTTQSGIVYYPNPCTGKLFIESTESPVISVLVSDLLGKTILQQAFHTNNVVLLLSDMPPGQYLMTTRTAQREQTDTIIKQ